ncbi:hypothetical protein DL766_002211 [Monosporascus sp. MC13-8B]|uniref:Uncharacterized protein n=1 Tax=Monosporascus cannonballus TaxID=155416 RepID=A0ABY0GQR2_9PEZI|nr:hypothetical protein DL762_010502 [Monosporascus cannonballus]RYO80589.1 hypothetical protein DL763_008855 [Monosporascus cannonballus]RYP36029.1 hypothetical protein DL766_002211 [Monosporascus sp. MC13-8B]
MPLDTGSSNNRYDGDLYEDSSFQDSAIQHSPWPYVSYPQQLQLQKRHFEVGATIHFERLSGLQFWAPVFLFPDSIRVATIVKRVIGASTNAQRRLTAGEVDALSEHANDAARKLAWAHPTSVAIAAAATANGRKTFKFPFYQPKMTSFDPYYFPKNTLPSLKGARAAATWHFLRFLAYCPLTWIGSVMFFSSIADTSFHAHLLRDSRLASLVKDIQSAHKKTSRPALADSPGTSQSPQPYCRDDYPDSSAPPMARPSWGTPQAQQEEQRESNGPDYPARNASWDSSPLDDDASPVTPAARRAEEAQAQRSPSGSAWDRLRQQTRSDTSDFTKGDSSGSEKGWTRLRQDRAPGTAGGPRSTEQYSYSRQDEEREKRNYDREQAQKEFDALLESERRGGSSNGRM